MTQDNDEGFALPDSDTDSGEDNFLESLLAESLDTIHKRAEVKDLRKRKAAGNLRTGKELEEANTKIREWEMAREWKAAANVAMFNVQQCSCGSTHSVFSGWFQRQAHRSSKINRWIRPDAEPLASLPKERQDLHLPNTTICASCAASQGYGTEKIGPAFEAPSLANAPWFTDTITTAMTEGAPDGTT